ncbi:hypothetical protein T05_9819 [Trichinella murrelli]|uniref:Uncharacterized protein n=1 Tax=Trichinella murrelli TaxID=144512 RepID=A0A0V0TAN3_9BILA|nr:hypothetical protein T05_9819 [Trichinella murrelli]
MSTSRARPSGHVLSPAASGIFRSSFFPVVFAVLPRAAASRDTASAGRNELLDSAFCPSSPSPGTYSSPVSSALRTDHSSTFLAWSCPRLASTPGRLAHTRVCGLCCPSRTSGAVARGLPFPGPLRIAAWVHGASLSGPPVLPTSGTPGTSPRRLPVAGASSIAAVPLPASSPRPSGPPTAGCGWRPVSSGSSVSG